MYGAPPPMPYGGGYGGYGGGGGGGGAPICHDYQNGKCVTLPIHMLWSNARARLHD
jgi:hypothetical protein